MQAVGSGRSPAPGSNRDAPTSPTPKAPSASFQSLGSNEAYVETSATTQNFTTSPSNGRRSLDRAGQSYVSGTDPERSPDPAEGAHHPLATVLVRKLPASVTQESLISMLLFADDLVEARLTPHDYPDENGFISAIARFRTVDAAVDVRNRLNGKPNASQDSTMVVEVLHNGRKGSPDTRRRSSDAHPNRQLSASASSTGSGGPPGSRHTSRYNNAFHGMDKLSPTRRPHAPGSIDLPAADVNSHLQNIFSPQSPIGTSIGDRPRATGKSVISDDAVDDDTGELLKDPLAYAKSGQMSSHAWHPRSINASMHSLKLETSADAFVDGTNMMSPTGSGGFASSRQIPPPLKSPGSEFAPGGMANGMSPMSPSAAFPISPQGFQRHQYPPANPADQNPPCNTLYVGNLPLDTSEDELKALFSKQRGYKRLCFRTKHNGPMCFVEFEDISFATKALNELYGQPLHNSVKGGIRLSFSKNPLGVRTGQANGMGPVSPLASPNAPGFGSSVGVPPGFSTANGPPPGLPMPGNNMGNAHGASAASFFTPGSPPLSSATNHGGFGRQSISGTYSGVAPSGGNLHSVGTGFSDFPMGR